MVKSISQRAKRGRKAVAKKGIKVKKPPREKQPRALKIVKAEENPIISPRPENEWEAWQTFNPGVILLKDKVHFLYRAIGEDGLSRFGYAVSDDGFRIEERLSYPVYEHRVGQRPSFNVFSYFSGGSFGGAEDPRIVRVDDEDTLYMTYTACEEGLRVAITSIKVDDFLNKRWKWKPPVLISPPGEVHKNWVIFPEKINPVRNGVSNGANGKYAILHSISPEISIAYLDNLEFEDNRYIESYYNSACRKNCWDTCVRGAGAPPLKTKYGWLLFYHAQDLCDPGKYKVGAMLLDTNNPTKVLCRSPEPILEPTEVYENNGFKGGVVYASGAVVKDGRLLLYYGAADSYIGVAHADFDGFLEELVKGLKPKLEKKPLRKK
jgi:predicted GH43/DUF377 family glycosyl hydrolase